jgi:acyl-CoA thioester hydrolase
MTHKTYFEVRDYECDLQGIVNHAVYLNYMEHSRHQFLKDAGGDFAALHNEGLDLVVAHADVSYHASLRSGDRFVVDLTVTLSGKVRLLFHQKIIRLSDEKPMVTAIMTVAGVRDGRPVRIDRILALPT